MGFKTDTSDRRNGFLGAWNRGLKMCRLPDGSCGWRRKDQVKDGKYIPPPPPKCACGRKGAVYVCDDAMERKGHWECVRCNRKANALGHVLTRSEAEGQ